MSDADRFSGDLAAKAMRVGGQVPRHPERRESAPPRRPDVIAARRHQAERVVPPRFVVAELGDAPPGVSDQLEDWTGGPDRNLVLVGPVGSGKTHLAAAVVMAAYARHGEPARFRWTTVAGLLDRWRPDAEPDEGPLPVVCKRAPLLVLDDLGAERATDWTTERLGLLVDYRWSARLPTVVTTNLKPGHEGPMMEHLGERTYSRLVGGALVLRLTDDDKRRQR